MLSAIESDAELSRTQIDISKVKQMEGTDRLQGLDYIGYREKDYTVLQTVLPFAATPID